VKWPFETCPVCGGELVDRVVEKLLRGGVDTAVLKISSDVCTSCGERLYPQKTIRQFEGIRERLARRDTAGLQPVGRSFEVP
jgi:YgiT-type zinc finger domain-containing protein